MLSAQQGIWSVVIVGVVACSSTFAGACQPDGAPPLEALITKLNEYERAFHGLSFDVSWESSRARGLTSLQREFVSRNGRIRACEGRSRSRARRDGLNTSSREFLYGEKSCADEGWQFGISRMVEPGGALGEAGMTVTFYPPRTTGAISQWAHQGFIEDQTFAAHAQQCEVTIQSGVFSEVPVWAMLCDHPKILTTTFYFDKETLQLIGYRTRRVGGDEYRVGAIHIPPAVMPEGTWAESTDGPIEYMIFAGRLVPESIPFSADSSEPDSYIEGVIRFTNYALLDRDLTSKIEFETIELPDDGERVTSQGEEGIRYELRDGKVVKVIDADARRSAARARFYRSNAFYTWWYVIGAVLAVGIVGFLAYRWSRRE